MTMRKKGRMMLRAAKIIGLGQLRVKFELQGFA